MCRSYPVLAGSSPNQLQSVGSVPRKGFETAMLARTAKPHVAVRAKNRSEEVLGTNEPIKL